MSPHQKVRKKVDCTLCTQKVHGEDLQGYTLRARVIAKPMASRNRRTLVQKVLYDQAGLGTK